MNTKEVEDDFDESDEELFDSLDNEPEKDHDSLDDEANDRPLISHPAIKIVGAIAQGKFLVFEGCSHFRQRVICSTLTGKPIKIDGIRANDSHPGLRGSIEIVEA